MAVDITSFFHLAVFRGNKKSVFQVPGIHPFNRNASRDDEPTGTPSHPGGELCANKVLLCTPLEGRLTTCIDAVTCKQRHHL